MTDFQDFINLDVPEPTGPAPEPDVRHFIALPAEEVAALRADAGESDKRLEALIRVRRERDALRAEVAALRAKAAAADRVRESLDSHRGCDVETIARALDGDQS